MNKHIRVLTGAHAGASLDLAPGQWTIGHSADASIRITDWTAEPLSLHVDAERGVSITADGGDEPWADLQPRRCAEIVVCVGPAGEPWPSDLELLQRVLSAAPAAQAATVNAAVDASTAATIPARPRARAAWMGVAAVALLTPCALLLASTREAQQKAGPREIAPAPLIERVRTSLAQHSIDGLNIEQHDAEITVHGVVTSAAEELSTLRDLHAISPQIHTDLSIAPEIVENLRESLQEPGLRIAYLGGNRFSIAGAALHPDRVRATAEHVRGDLGGNVKDIVLEVAQARPRDDKTDANSALSVDDLHYVESSDGTKDFLAAQR